MTVLVRILLGASLLLVVGLGGPPAAVAAQDEAKPKAKDAGPAAKPKKATDLIDEAQKSARGGDIEGAVKRVDEALALEPTNRQALYLAAALREDLAAGGERPKNNPLFVKAAALMRQLRAAHKDLDENETMLFQAALYNEACTLATEGKTRQALDVLAEVADAGFTQLDTLDGDEELNALRKLPAFQELRAKIEAKAIAAAKEHARTELAENKPFPFDFSLPDTAGKTVKRADFQGKVTLVDVWGTWCPPCRMEIPHFVKLYEKYHDRGLAIVGLNYEQVPDKEIKATIQAFVKENKVPYPCLIGDDKTQEQIPNFEGFPTTLFLDRSGTVRLKAVGYHSYADLEAVVTALLEEPKGGAKP